tara:strand:- start:30803 stop:31687 length:885 start_codon:yes stop_codon:yes gene_type:complete
MLAPIAIFTYKRLEHTRKTIEALVANPQASQSEVFIYADGPRNEQDQAEVTQVRDYLKTLSGFKSVTLVERPENLGLSANVIDGVGALAKQYGRVIVLEDDVVVSPFFLEFMNAALELYRDEDGVGAVGGYVFPHKVSFPDTFFYTKSVSWGWATWERAWAHFEPKGHKLCAALREQGVHYALIEEQARDDRFTWAALWLASLLHAGKLILYPGVSLARNIGHDGTGEHCPVGDLYDSALAEVAPQVKRIPIAVHPEAPQAFDHYYEVPPKPNFFVKLANSCGKRWRSLRRIFN